MNLSAAPHLWYMQSTVSQILFVFLSKYTEANANAECGINIVKGKRIDVKLWCGTDAQKINQNVPIDVVLVTSFGARGCAVATRYRVPPKHPLTQEEKLGSQPTFHPNFCSIK